MKKIIFGNSVQFFVFAYKQIIARFGAGVGVFLFIFLGVVGQAQAATYVSGSLSSDATWDSAHSPYVVTGVYYIDKRATLTVGPGVVVKFTDNSSRFDVSGKLVVNGIETQPVYFTSLRDDAVGGDTNNDQNATAPNSGDWAGIVVTASGNGIFNFTHVRYGGVPTYYTTISGGIFNMSGTVYFANGKLYDNSFAGLMKMYAPASNPADWVFPSTTVVNSEIFNNRRYGIAGCGTLHMSQSSLYGNAYLAENSYYSYLDPQTQCSAFDMWNNWWGDQTGPFSFNYNQGGRGNQVNVDAGTSAGEFRPWLRRDPMRYPNPVILIPGILGTELSKGNDLLWMNISSLFFSASDDFMDPLSMTNSGLSADGSIMVTGTVIRKKNIPFFGQHDYFGSLVQSFTDVGYQEGIDLFVFPYDWRLDNRTNSQLLKDKIDQVMQQTGALQVDVIAHSMGGLIAKQYMLNNPTNPINKMVFIGTPHWGAPKATKALLFGDNLGVEKVISFLNPQEIKKIGHNMLSLYEMIPSRAYFSNNRYGGYFYDLIDGKIRNYSETKSFLQTSGLNSQLLDSADSFHSTAMDSFSVPNTKVYSISGCNMPTINQIIRRNNWLNEEEYFIGWDAGDGTVPLDSSDGISVGTGKRFFVKDAKHDSLPSDVDVRNLVVNIISSNTSTISLPSRVMQNRNACQASGQIVSVHSPVDLNVYDTLGNHVGPGPSSSIDVNIPGAAYEEIANNKFVFLPNDSGIYTVNLTGTATGSFHLRLTEVNNSTTTEAVYFDTVAVTAKSRGTLQLNTATIVTTTPTVAFSSTGNGNTTTLTAATVLSGAAAVDLVAPSTTLLLNGAVHTPNDWFNGGISLRLVAQDAESGVLRSEYRLGDVGNWVTTTSTTTISLTTSTKIYYRSIDRAGNLEPEHFYTALVDAIPPEATFYFVTSTKKIGIRATDNFTVNPIVILIGTSTARISDTVGNTTELRYTDTVMSSLVSRKISAVLYNGVTSTANYLAGAIFTTSWALNKDQSFFYLMQTVIASGLYSISSDYRSATASTTIKGSTSRGPLPTTVYAGLKIIETKIDRGVISYFIK